MGSWGRERTDGQRDRVGDAWGDLGVLQQPDLATHPGMRGRQGPWKPPPWTPDGPPAEEPPERCCPCTHRPQTLSSLSEGGPEGRVTRPASSSRAVLLPTPVPAELRSPAHSPRGAVPRENLSSQVLPRPSLWDPAPRARLLEPGQRGLPTPLLPPSCRAVLSTIQEPPPPGPARDPLLVHGTPDLRCWKPSGKQGGPLLGGLCPECLPSPRPLLGVSVRGTHRWNQTLCSELSNAAGHWVPPSPQRWVWRARGWKRACGGWADTPPHCHRPAQLQIRGAA